MSDGAHWEVLPDDVREWLEIQRDRSAIPAEDEMLLETFPHGQRHFMVAYPFEGRLAHTTLAMLLTRRLERLGVGPLGFVCNDYALAIWSLKPMDGLDFADLFAEDMLGDDLESWLAESSMMKAAFKACALISGLIERRFRGDQKSGRQITFSTDLVYDVLRRHQPDHLLLRCARADAAQGLVDVARLGRAAGADQGPHPPRRARPPLAVLGADDPGDRPAALAGRRRRDDPGRGRRDADRRGDRVSAEPARSATPSRQARAAALALELAGAEVLLRASGALWLAAERLLVVADLHLEKGSAYAARGQMLPPYDTARDPGAAWPPRPRSCARRTIVLLGDSFHDGGGEARLAPRTPHA